MTVRIASESAEGEAGTQETAVEGVTGQELSRPRRWHKFFERMGLMFQDSEGKTRLTDLGQVMLNLEHDSTRQFRRNLARQAISVLRKYQLKNPADELQDTYPDDCDVHPYWAIWKAATALDGRLHWDELNRVLMHVLREEDLDKAIDHIRTARQQVGYDPVKNGIPGYPLGERAWQVPAAEGRDVDGQTRDQITTPFFKRAGFAEILLSSPGGTGAGYWKVNEDVRDLLELEASRRPGFFRAPTKEDWFRYYGALPTAEQEPPPSFTSGSPWLNLLLRRGNVIFYGPPGTGKTTEALNIAEQWTRSNGTNTVFNVTFHPSYGYEDFVEGFRPKEDDPSEFELTNGVLLLAVERANDLAQQAGNALPAPVLLLIDEINRGDVARIFGELITYIEADKRGRSFILSQSPKKVRTIPTNLYFLGTMNTADKSISLLDVGLRRRFAFVEFPPDPGTFKRVKDWLSEVEGIDLGALMQATNRRLRAEGIDPDRALGQALFAVSKDAAEPLAALRDRLTYDIVPLVLEYCYMDRPRAKRILPGLVDDDGRLFPMSDAALLEGLMRLSGGASTSDGAKPATTGMAAPAPAEVVQPAPSDAQEASAGGEGGELGNRPAGESLEVDLGQ